MNIQIILIFLLLCVFIFILLFFIWIILNYIHTKSFYILKRFAHLLARSSLSNNEIKSYIEYMSPIFQNDIIYRYRHIRNLTNSISGQIGTFIAPVILKAVTIEVYYNTIIDRKTKE
jgi:hypothetical protein